MKNCPKCNSGKLVKNGFNQGRQRYKCRQCGHNPSVEERGYPKNFRLHVVRTYLEGVGIRALSRIFNIGLATVSRWIQEIADQVGEIEKPKSVEVMEIDELHHWIGSKKQKNGYGLQFAAVPVGYSPGKWVVVEYAPQKSFGKKSQT